MIQTTWKQGQTVGISVVLNEELNGRDLYLGLYQYSIKNINRNAILMLSTNNGLTQIGTTAYSAKISNTVTKKLEVGTYRLEALLKDENVMQEMSIEQTCDLDKWMKQTLIN